MKHLTIRALPPDLAKALDRERRRRGQSLTQTVKDLLRQALGVSVPPAAYDNGLGRLAGGWSDEDLAAFERDTAVFERIDDEVWRAGG